MAWKVENMESQKQKFILLFKTGKFTKKALCAEFGISRPTGDLIIKRFEEEGWDALLERNKKPYRHPNQTPVEIENDIVNIRNRYPHWGARKIVELLLREWESEFIPSETTVNNIMKRYGLTIPRHKARRKIQNHFPIFDPHEPNEVWSADFKGKFRMGNREYCNPLTIADSMSRFLFAIEALERPDTEASRPIFERVFRENGLPIQLHTDNGAPFGNSMALRRMTQLSVWIMDLGVTPVYSDPGHPQQNGRHERMHRDLKAESTRPPGVNIRAQQKMFDRFREDYNTVRPHESLGMKTPEEVHIRSIREYPNKIPEWYYPKESRTKIVTVNGAIRFDSERLVMVSTALSGRYIGLEEIEQGIWLMYYRHVQLGYFSERTNEVYEVEDFNF